MIINELYTSVDPIELSRDAIWFLTSVIVSLSDWFSVSNFYKKEENT